MDVYCSNPFSKDCEKKCDEDDKDCEKKCDRKYKSGSRSKSVSKAV